ncbi:hypothetical protein PR048_005545 [Dryococelus australis]|uniref:Uncharacterized protein n=1 Tax=Dryococelus australis TaxID=614101 RepID=A0ABQ9I8I6_9NEOP|nr:hypothetical protein PR048_005545 [Dryococelus australis]
MFIGGVRLRLQVTKVFAVLLAAGCWALDVPQRRYLSERRSSRITFVRRRASCALDGEKVEEGVLTRWRGYMYVRGVATLGWGRGCVPYQGVGLWVEKGVVITCGQVAGGEEGRSDVIYAMSLRLEGELKGRARWRAQGTTLDPRRAGVAIRRESCSSAWRDKFAKHVSPSQLRASARLLVPGRTNTRILLAAGDGLQGRGKQKITEKSRRQAASSGTIPTCENLRETPPGIEPGSTRIPKNTGVKQLLIPRTPVAHSSKMASRANNMSGCCSLTNKRLVTCSPANWEHFSAARRRYSDISLVTGASRRENYENNGDDLGVLIYLSKEFLATSSVKNAENGKTVTYFPKTRMNMSKDSDFRLFYKTVDIML